MVPELELLQPQHPGPGPGQRQAAALPSAPSPTTTASHIGPAGRGRGPRPARRARRVRSPSSPSGRGRSGGCRGWAPPWGEPAAAVGPRGHAALDALAHGPVLAVDQVPEVGRVRGSKPGRACSSGWNSSSQTTVVPRPVRPEGEGGHVVGGQAQHQVGVDQLALVAGALVVVQARERRPVALAGGREGPGALAVGMPRSQSSPAPPRLKAGTTRHSSVDAGAVVALVVVLGDQLPVGPDP